MDVARRAAAIMARMVRNIGISPVMNGSYTPGKQPDAPVIPKPSG
jgi:hypothetical protein